MRVGVVDGGSRARERASSWSRLGVDQVIVLDPGGESDDGRIAGPNEPPSDIHSFLDQVDLVDVCTRSPLAASVVTEAASAGLPVLCGWAFVSTLGEAQVIAEAFDDHDVPLLAAGLRCMAPFAAAQQAVAHGNVGAPAVLRLSMRSTPPAILDPELRASIFRESMVSALDYVRWIAGEVDTIHASVTSRGPVFAVAIAKHRGGAISHLEASWADRTPALRIALEISGAEGLIVFRSDGAEPISLRMSGDGEPREVVAPSSVDWQLQGVLAMLGGVAELVSAPTDWVEALRLALAAQESSTRGSPIRMDQESPRVP